jgi:hypothetical protein
LSGSSMNFWIWPRVPTPLCSTPKFSITCASMRDLMRTLMPANVIAFAEVWTPNLRNGWIWWRLIISMS